MWFPATTDSLQATSTRWKVRKSEFSTLKDLLTVSASCSRPKGVMKGDLDESVAAMVSTTQLGQLKVTEVEYCTGLARHIEKGTQAEAICRDGHRLAFSPDVDPGV